MFRLKERKCTPFIRNITVKNHDSVCSLNMMTHAVNEDVSVQCAGCLAVLYIKLFVLSVTTIYLN